ncbi:MAG: DDE-type integrase/transposase/recombinase [bacterium]
MRIVERIALWLEKEGIFQRERNPNDKRALGILLYHGGLSYENAGRAVGVSNQSIKNWYAKGAEFFQSLDKERRKRVAVDEKVIHLPDGDAYLWAAVDLEREDEGPIAIMVSQGRSSLEALAFMKKVKAMCKGRLPRIFVDGGEWYPWAFQRLGFKRWNVMSFGPRSAIERFFSQVDRRYKAFCERFPFRSTLKSLKTWMEAFSGILCLQRTLS